MARYWWQCISCGDRPAWLAVCHSRSIAAFIWDELAPSGWDQRLLRRRCKCKRRSLYITYRFQRSDPERISVKHIVGLGPDGDYLPMLWETFRHSTPRTRWMDFKYQRGRSPWGLNKRVILEKAQLARLLRAYEHATGLKEARLKNILAVAAMAIIASLAAARPFESHVVVQNDYYAKAGKADDVYQWRLHASDVRVKLGFARGRVLRRIDSGDAKELPDVIWECDYPTMDAREREAAAVGAAPEFQAVQKHMSTLIRRFERGTYLVESH